MKRFTLLAALGLCSISLFAQDAQKEEPKEEGFVFTTVKELPITSVKNQSRAGTCWCYSSMAFLESELLRMGKGEYDFSEMYIVHQTYLDRADAAVRTHGDVSFSQGGSFYDVIYGMKKFGLVPEEVMRPGVMYGDTLSNHTELTAVSDAVVAAIAKGKLRKLQTDNNHNPLWKKAIAAIHDIYLGKCPEKFTYKGKEYTPHSFFESTGLNPNDYISLTSYTHHPFYEPFVLEIQDNWRWGQSYNLPIDEFMQVFDNAINNGYPIAWGSDVSEQGFTRDGVAVMPDTEKVQELSGSDMAHWLKMKPEEKKLNTKPQPQKWCTQEERQEAYDNWETTDDHGMLIYGIAKDQESEGMDKLPQYMGDFLTASNMAGFAFGTAGCAAVHALSYPLGGTYHVPHGESNYALFTGVLYKYMEKKQDGEIAHLNAYLAELLHCDVKNVYNELENLLNHILPKKPLHEYGVTEADIPVFTDNVLATQGRLTANNFVPLSRDDILDIYKNLY